MTHQGFSCVHAARDHRRDTHQAAYLCERQAGQACWSDSLVNRVLGGWPPMQVGLRVVCVEQPGNVERRSASPGEGLRDRVPDPGW